MGLEPITNPLQLSSIVPTEVFIGAAKALSETSEEKVTPNKNAAAVRRTATTKNILEPLYVRALRACLYILVYIIYRTCAPVNMEFVGNGEMFEKKCLRYYTNEIIRNHSVKFFM